MDLLQTLSTATPASRDAPSGAAADLQAEVDLAGGEGGERAFAELLDGETPPEAHPTVEPSVAIRPAVSNVWTIAALDIASNDAETGDPMTVDAAATDITAGEEMAAWVCKEMAQWN